MILAEPVSAAAVPKPRTQVRFLPGHLPTACKSRRRALWLPRAAGGGQRDVLASRGFPVGVAPGAGSGTIRQSSLPFASSSSESRPQTTRDAGPHSACTPLPSSAIAAAVRPGVSLPNVGMRRPVRPSVDATPGNPTHRCRGQGRAQRSCRRRGSRRGERRPAPAAPPPSAPVPPRAARARPRRRGSDAAARPSCSSG